MSYISSIRRTPTTMTAAEQTRLLRVSGEHVRGFRDHVIFAVALGTAMREMEIAALNVGDLFLCGKVRRRMELRVFKRCGSDPVPQTVFIPDDLAYKLKRFYSWKRRRGQSLAVDAPLFVSRLKRRIHTRSIRRAFRVWQERAELDRFFTFHELRHTALTNVYRATGDIRLTQRVARHKNLNTTTIYAGPSDDDVFTAVRTLAC